MTEPSKRQKHAALRADRNAQAEGTREELFTGSKYANMGLSRRKPVQKLNQARGIAEKVRKQNRTNAGKRR